MSVFFVFTACILLSPVCFIFMFVIFDDLPCRQGFLIGLTLGVSGLIPPLWFTASVRCDPIPDRTTIVPVVTTTVDGISIQEVKYRLDGRIHSQDVDSVLHGFVPEGSKMKVTVFKTGPYRGLYWPETTKVELYNGD
jgi:hypothetical protein